jgi:hypothetical protein
VRSEKLKVASLVSRKGAREQRRKEKIKIGLEPGFRILLHFLLLFFYFSLSLTLNSQLPYLIR